MYFYYVQELFNNSNQQIGEKQVFSDNQYYWIIARYYSVLADNDVCHQ